METNRAHPLTFASIALICFAIANAIAVTGHSVPEQLAVATPTPYSADHARITNEEPQPPTF